MHRYIVTETLISMAVNAAFSAGFAFLIFGGQSEIGLWGSSGLALDFAPQTFVVALMSVVVPTALARRRIRSGVLVRHSGASSRLPRNLLLRALLVAVLATFALGGVATLVLAISEPDPLAFAAVLPLKIFYGALVASVVTPLALRAAMLDRTMEPS